jgi:hypothetical protein
MDGGARNNRQIAGIVAMLVALAVLAERAGGLGFPVRCLVLVLLRPAEAVARRFVVELAGADLPGLEHAFENRDGALDAAGLALRFRAFAAVLGALLPPPCRFDRWHGGRDRALRREAPRLGGLDAIPGGRAAYDTS